MLSDVKLSGVYCIFLLIMVWKRTGFSLLSSGPSTAACLVSLSRSALVNSRVLHTLFITRRGETLLILFWKPSGFSWNISQLFLGVFRYKLLFSFSLYVAEQFALNIDASCSAHVCDIWCEGICSKANLWPVNMSGFNKHSSLLNMRILWTRRWSHIHLQ